MANKLGLSDTEIRQVQTRGRTDVALLPGSEPPKATYHNPRTGQEFHGLPRDPYSLELYMIVHGLVLGPAPKELRDSYEVSKTIVGKKSLRGPANEVVRIDREATTGAKGDPIPGTSADDLRVMIKEAVRAALAAKEEEAPQEKTQPALNTQLQLL